MSLEALPCPAGAPAASEARFSRASHHMASAVAGAGCPEAVILWDWRPGTIGGCRGSYRDGTLAGLPQEVGSV